MDPEKQELLERSKREFCRRRKVVIRNIPDGVDLEKLKTTILEGLDVINVLLENKSVLILFKDVKQTEEGLRTLKGLKEFEDQGITIDFPEPDSLLFVGNLPFEFTDDQFGELMSRYGNLERVFLVRSELTGESKGYGFAEYSDKNTAGDVKSRLLKSGAKYIMGKILRVDFAEPNLHTYKDLQSKTLFIDRLPKDLTDGEVLRKLFSESGKVTYAQVAINNQLGTSRGFAFVDYETSEEAERGQIAHNYARLGNFNIRTSYGTPGRSGASILGPLLPAIAQKCKKPVPLMSTQLPNTPIRPPLPWSQMNPRSFMTGSSAHNMKGPLPSQHWDPRANFQPRTTSVFKGNTPRQPMAPTGLISPTPNIRAQSMNPRGPMPLIPGVAAQSLNAKGPTPLTPTLTAQSMNVRGPTPLTPNITSQSMNVRGPTPLTPNVTLQSMNPRGPTALTPNITSQSMNPRVPTALIPDKTAQPPTPTQPSSSMPEVTPQSMNLSGPTPLTPNVTAQSMNPRQPSPLLPGGTAQSINCVGPNSKTPVGHRGASNTGPQQQNGPVPSLMDTRYNSSSNQFPNNNMAPQTSNQTSGQLTPQPLMQPLGTSSMPSPFQQQQQLGTLSKPATCQQQSHSMPSYQQHLHQPHAMSQGLLPNPNQQQPLQQQLMQQHSSQGFPASQQQHNMTLQYNQQQHNIGAQSNQQHIAVQSNQQYNMLQQQNNTLQGIQSYQQHQQQAQQQYGASQVLPSYQQNQQQLQGLYSSYQTNQQYNPGMNGPVPLLGQQGQGASPNMAGNGIGYTGQPGNNTGPGTPTPTPLMSISNTNTWDGQQRSGPQHQSQPAFPFSTNKGGQQLHGNKLKPGNTNMNYKPSYDSCSIPSKRPRF